MRTILLLMTLSILVFSLFFANAPETNAENKREKASTVQDDRNDNRRRGRGRDESGRGRGSDDRYSNSNSNSDSNSRSGDSVSRREARAAALRRVDGTIIKEEFEQRRGRRYFEFYIRATGGDMYEVYVDADSGSVFKVERRSDR
jgi:hypothetical protein